jgi:predicted enzyme related to lactoylglutathione lyase
MPRVVHFEIHAGDPERAVKFYQTLFGWNFQKWEGPMEYWMVITGPDDQPGINGGMIAYVCTVDVANVDASLKTALDNGAQIALPKMAIPGVGWLVYCKDTEGNIFGMMQNDPSAQ